jgi:lipopolysaccharide transport system ATP-binding protein
VIEFLTPPVRLVSDHYGTHAVVWDREFKNLYCGQIGPTFHIRDEVLNPDFGVFHEPVEWRWVADGDCPQIIPKPSGQWSMEKQI